jgi:hypothetical protein
MKQRTLWMMGLLLAGVADANAEPKPPTGLCATQPGSICIAQEAAVTAPERKYNPGHYMTPYLGESHSAVLGRADEVCREPALEGLQLKVRWSSLEPKAGQFDFKALDDIYERLASCRKRLVVEVWAVSFDKSRSRDIIPPDLEPHSLASTNVGYIAKLWEPQIMDRFVRLYQALGTRYDPKPYFEAIIFTETATGQVDPNSGYSATAFIQQLLRGLSNIRPAWPQTNILLYANYLRGSTNAQFAQLVAELEKLDIGIGGPDVLPPPDVGTTGERIYRGEIGGVDYRGRMLAGWSVQQAQLGGKQGTWTPKQLYDHCTYTNQCKYMFWVRNTTVGGPEQKWTTGILPFIRANPIPY